MWGCELLLPHSQLRPQWTHICTWRQSASQGPKAAAGKWVLEVLRGVVQLLSHVRLCNPRTAACQASLPFTISRVWSNSCPLNGWCHQTISSSVPFSSFPQSLPGSGSFTMNRFLCIRWPKYWSIRSCVSHNSYAEGLASVPQNMTIFGGDLKRWLNYNETIRVGPIQSDWCPYKRKSGYTKRHQGCEHRGKLPWGHSEKTVTCEPSREPSEETEAAPELGLLTHRLPRNTLPWFRSPGQCSVRQHWENNTRSEKLGRREKWEGDISSLTSMLPPSSRACAISCVCFHNETSVLVPFFIMGGGGEICPPPQISRGLEFDKMRL